MATLFRRWGCLALINQQGQEGTIGKIARLLPHIQMHACGRYKREVEKLGLAAKLAELVCRRAGLRSPAQCLYDELLAETMHAEFEHLPSRKNETRYTLSDITHRIDECIAGGKVIARLQYETEHARFLIVSTAVTHFYRVYLFKYLSKKKPNVRKY